MNREEYRAVQMFAIGLVLAMVARVWGARLWRCAYSKHGIVAKA